MAVLQCVLASRIYKMNWERRDGTFGADRIGLSAPTIVRCKTTNHGMLGVAPLSAPFCIGGHVVAPAWRGQVSRPGDNKMSSMKASATKSNKRRASTYNEAKKAKVNRFPRPILAAYECGRLWNQLSWHMPQASLSSSPYHGQQVSAIVDSLVRQASRTRPHDEQKEIEEALKAIIRDWAE
jgi:hypothetical protein